MTSCIPVAALLLLLCALSAPARAQDGVIEINQAKALAGGVVPADTPGFPVLLNLPGSYRLTSDLVVPDHNTTAIFISGDQVTIDLSGFGIRGPVICTESGGSVLCSPLGTGIGIDTQFVPLLGVQADRTTIRNGYVSGMGSSGIVVREGALVDSVLVEHCAGGGVRARADSLVTRSRLLLNGTVGLEAVSGVVTFEGNRIAEIGGPTVIGATEIGGNTCDDGLCSAVPLRRYYLTTAEHAGGQALTACDVGYHMASIYELHDPSNLSYDNARGESNLGDSPPGPPAGTALGWVRTGYTSETSFVPGTANCDAWASSDLGDWGNRAGLSVDWLTPSQTSTPWLGGVNRCNIEFHVWCVQD